MVLLKQLFKRGRYEFAYLADFILENLLLSITFVVCMLLAIKDSAVPFFPNTPGWLMKIFETPATPGIATIIDGLVIIPLRRRRQSGILSSSCPTRTAVP